MRHGLGIAIFSVLSAVSLSVIGCGGTGSGMGVLDPFPTGAPSTSPGTSTPVPPAPYDPTDKVNDVVATGDLRNPVYQYVDDGKNVYTVQGYTATTSGMNDQQCKYRLLKYKTTDNNATPQEIEIEIRNADNNNYTKGDLANPYYITGIIDDYGTAEDKGDDHLYLAITDLGTANALYLMDLGARQDGWNKAKAINVFNCGSDLKPNSLLTCSFGSTKFNRGQDAINTLFYTDYSDTTGAVRYVVFDENFFKDAKLTDKLSDSDKCGIALSNLNYPAVVKANEGPWATVTCQGDSKVYFFANNTTKADYEKKERAYPLTGQDNKYFNFIKPENKNIDLQNPYDFAWTSGVAEDGGDENYYLTIASGFTPKTTRASSPSDKCGLWMYKFNAAKYKDSLKNLNTNDGDYTLIDDLANEKSPYPVNITFTNNSSEQNDKRYLDIAYLTTGTASINSQNDKELRGKLKFCRYDVKNKKLIEKSKADLLTKIEDPFGLIALPGTLGTESYKVQFLFTTHWNWPATATEKSHIYSYSKNINLETDK